MTTASYRRELGHLRSGGCGYTPEDRPGEPVRTKGGERWHGMIRILGRCRRKGEGPVVSRRALLGTAALGVAGAALAACGGGPSPAPSSTTAAGPVRSARRVGM